MNRDIPVCQRLGNVISFATGDPRQHISRVTWKWRQEIQLPQHAVEPQPFQAHAVREAHVDETRVRGALERAWIELEAAVGRPLSRTAPEPRP